LEGDADVRCFAVATALLFVSAPAGADAPIWAKSGIRIEANCDSSESAASPTVKSPDKTVEVAVRCKALNGDNADMALIVRHGGQVREIALPKTVRDGWRPQELLWSSDGRQFILNGSENAYAGNAFLVVNLHDRNPKAREITEAAQHDMVRRFPPCKAANREEEICRPVERHPHFNMSAITWTRDSRAVVVMAEVPSSSSYGGIMGQVEGYEIDSVSGRILKRLSATQFKARWQSKMAFTMTIPPPAVYGPGEQ
jgi:hypothetical protein